MPNTPNGKSSYRNSCSFRSLFLILPFTETQVREKNIEQSFMKAVREHGGLAPKFTSPGFDGMPDRIILFPGGRVAFAELKAPGRKPRPVQAARHELLRELGFKVYVIDNKTDIMEVINDIQTT